MADDQETSNDMGDENQGDDYVYPDGNDPVVQPTTTVPPPPPTPSVEETQPPYEPYNNNNNDGGNVFQDEYDDDEPLPDVTVNLVINGDGENVNPDGLVTDIVNAGLTDEIGKLATTTPSITDTVDRYTAAITQGVFDEFQNNGTAIEEKGFWGKFIKKKENSRRQIEYLKYVCLGVYVSW